MDIGVAGWYCCYPPLVLTSWWWGWKGWKGAGSEREVESLVEEEQVEGRRCGVGCWEAVVVVPVVDVVVGVGM